MSQSAAAKPFLSMVSILMFFVHAYLLLAALSIGWQIAKRGNMSH